jgi:hypothetical protein
MHKLLVTYKCLPLAAILTCCKYMHNMIAAVYMRPAQTLPGRGIALQSLDAAGYVLAYIELHAHIGLYLNSLYQAGARRHNACIGRAAILSAW